MKHKIEPVYWIGLVIALIVLIVMLPRNPPEFFDKFGVVFFGFLTVLGIWMISTKKEVPTWAEFLVFSIAVLGLIADFYITFIK